MVGKKGKPPKYVIHPRTKKPIVGLHFWKTRGIYYTWEMVLGECDKNGKSKRKKKYFGTDLPKAIFLYEQYCARKEKKPVILKTRSEEILDVNKLSSPDVDKSSKPNETAAERTQRILNEFTESENWEIQADYATVLPDDTSLWLYFRDILLTNKAYAEKRMDMKIQIIDTDLSSNSIPLSELIKTYTRRDAKPLKNTQVSDAKNYFGQFCECVKVNSVAEICYADIQKFQRLIYSTKYKPRTIKNCFDYIKDIVRYNIAKRVNDTEIQQLTILFFYLEKFDYPSKKQMRTRPVPITRDDFWAIYNKTDDVMCQAIWLLCLNCGFRQSEIVHLLNKKPDIDLDLNTLNCDRHKTGILCAAILWEETVNAIKAYLNERQEKGIQSEYLFCIKRVRSIIQIQYIKDLRNIAKWQTRNLLH